MEPSAAKPRRRGLILLVLLVAAYPAYIGVMYLVRKHVDGRVAASQGRVIDFALTDRNGVIHRSSDLRGKIVVLNFFRSKCTGCRAERDAIVELARRADPEHVVVLGVMMDDVEGYGAEVTAQTLAEFDYEHPVLMADESFVDEFHGAGWAHVTPVTYYLGVDGTVVASLRGHQTLDALLAPLE